MTGPRVGRRGQLIPPSVAEIRYPGRTPHWIKPNSAERIPHRWIVADTESKAARSNGVEVQTLRCWDAVRWRTDLKTGELREEASGEDARSFWRWVLEHCYPHGRTVLWFHHAGVDLAWLNAFAELPALGCELRWCNLDRDVSVATWRTPGGTLVIADTYTWTNVALEALSAMVGIPKPRLPSNASDLAVWHHRCRSDVLITEQVVRHLLAFVREHHLGNWQPSGAGMGWAAWRHQFYDHKVLVHDDAAALAAEREAMHAGRAEAWWHGRARGGPFTEWDMRQSYTTIARDCLLPAKLWHHDYRPSRQVHQFGLDHFRTLARVQVKTAVPCVPARVGGRVVWPVGEFETTLWDTELELLRAAGGSYEVAEQWRYTAKPALARWAAWTIAMCALEPPAISLVAKTWVKHQGRAVIGRMGLRTAAWEPYAANWLPGYTGVTLLSEKGGEAHRMMHVGGQVWRESDRAETQQSVPQITSWIMAEARVRLWRAAEAAGISHVLHVDTDSLIADAQGSRQLEAAIAAGLTGEWRVKAVHRALELVGPRHYFAPAKRQVPGVPLRARQTAPGRYEGEIWEAFATALTDGRLAEVRVLPRTWQPKRVDYRRPWRGEQDGAAVPVTAAIEEGKNRERDREGDRGGRAGQGARPGDLADQGSQGVTEDRARHARSTGRGAGQPRRAAHRGQRADRRGAAPRGGTR